ncbi:hypothetical protein GJAV_G00056530 [Gymnothorax javanicus]|nr:hypothetical protein GJAV_G00056530 [Gymnothorax javanicus]
MCMRAVASWCSNVNILPCINWFSAYGFPGSIAEPFPVQLLRALFIFINGLPSMVLKLLKELWNLVLFGVFTASQGIASAAQGVLVGWQQFAGSMSESFKMVGYLSSHVLVRTKEVFHHWVMLAHWLLLQLWEACAVALSLSLYLLNTLVNILLIGMQNCYCAVVWLYETVSGSLQKSVELALTMTTILYSSLLSILFLLWTPCQFVLDFLFSLVHVLISIFLLNAYGLALTVGIITATALYLKADVARHSVHHLLRYIISSPALRRLRRALRRLYPLVLERVQSVLEMGMWLQRGGRPALGQNSGVGDGTRPQALLMQPGSSADGDGVGGSSQQEDAARTLPDDAAGGSKIETSGSSANSLLTLLKEQEDLKKCVICHDSNKTVLLLPCRHLCLCRDCADLLLSQPVYRHNCPLCRHMILRTLDVYL